MMLYEFLLLYFCWYFPCLILTDRFFFSSYVTEIAANTAFHKQLIPVLTGTWRICHARFEDIVGSPTPVSPRDFTSMGNALLITSKANVVSELSAISARPDFVVKNSGSRMLVGAHAGGPTLSPGDKIALVGSSSVGCQDAVAGSLTIMDGNYVDFPRSGVYANAGSYTLCFAEATSPTRFRRQHSTLTLHPPSLSSLTPVGASPSYIVAGAPAVLRAFGGSIKSGDFFAILPSATIGCEHAATSRLQQSRQSRSGDGSIVLDISSSTSTAICESPPCNDMKVCVSLSESSLSFVDQGLSLHVRGPDVTGTVTQMRNQPNNRFTLLVPSGAWVSVVVPSSDDKGSCTGAASNATHRAGPVTCGAGKSTCVVNEWDVTPSLLLDEAPPFERSVCMAPADSGGDSDTDFVAQPGAILAQSSSYRMRPQNNLLESPDGSSTARAIRYDSGHVYTVFNGIPSVRVVKEDGSEGNTLISSSASVSLKEPWGLAISEDFFFVSDTSENNIHQFARVNARQASFRKTWSNVCKSYGSPQSIDIHEGSIFAVCNKNMLIKIPAGADDSTVLGSLQEQEVFDLAVGTGSRNPHLYFTTRGSKTGLFRVPDLGANLGTKEWLGSQNANDINFDVLTRDEHQAHGVTVHKMTGHVFVVRVQYRSPYSMSVMKFDPNAGSWTTTPTAAPVTAVGDYLKSGRPHGNQWRMVYLALKEEGDEASLLWLSQVEAMAETSSSIAVVTMLP